MSRYPRRPVRVDEHTIVLDGTPVFYRSAPAAGLPRLYLHGAPTSSDDWLPFLERTGGTAPDLIGFGRSGKGGHLDYSLEGHADFITRLLDELEIEAVKLIAHDWGAGGGLVFAQRHPDRIDKLVLIDAVPLLDGFSWHGLPAVWRRPALGELVMGSIPRWYLNRRLRGACVGQRAWTDEQLRAVWEQFDQGTQRALLRLHRAADPERLAAAGRQLETITAPALVIWGERDPWFAPQFADAYAERLQTQNAWKIEDAGHWPWLDRTDVIDAVDVFLGED
jgi:pimeloyl-ACP methyl ester carboxylesterase